MARAWSLVFVAILFEIAGTTSLKLSAGFTNLIPSIMIFVFYLFSLGTLAYALKWVPLSIAYALWAGLGTALTACIGFFYFGEQITTPILSGIILVIIGVVVIKLADFKKPVA